MTESFTQNDLIRYVYQEMTAMESETFVQELQSNPLLMQEYLDMLGTIDQLNTLLLEPSERVVTQIKKLARKPKGLEKV